MARGKDTCRILKEIRRQIAEANDIELITSECRHKGDCLGTCPKCEAEVRYLEQQLRARSLAGKTVAIAGISAGLILMSGCGGSSSNQSNETLQGEPVESTEQIEMHDTLLSDTVWKEDGEIPDEPETSGIKAGEVAQPCPTIPVVGEIIDPDGEEKVYDAIVDVHPTFPGGDEKLLEWISQHLVYPPNARDSHIEGRVVIQFMVKADGAIGDAKIIKGVDNMLDAEALRVVKSIPRFNPAMLNGKAVEAVFTLPIVFRLND